MTIQYQFASWQSSPKQPDPKTCAPCCKSWTTYITQRWGGQNLGCYAKRPVVGGSSLSSHASGAAFDWRYQNPGPGRAFMLDQILPWLINNSRELGVQSIHDYVGDRIWRPPGCSGRPTSPSPECGWKKQNGSGGQMGESWATWLHLEVLPSRWYDARTVEQMLATKPPPKPPDPPPKPPTDLEITEMYAVYKNPNGGYCFGRIGEWHAHSGTSALNLLVFEAGNGWAVDVKTGNRVSSWSQVGTLDAGTAAKHFERYLGDNYGKV